MNSTRITKIAIAAGFVVLGAWAAYELDTPPATAPATVQRELPANRPFAAAPDMQRDATRTEMAQLRERVAKLDADIADLRRGLLNPPTGTAAATPASGSVRAAATPSPERTRRRDDAAARAAAEQAERALAASRETAFRNEALDSAWARRSALQLQQAFADGGAAEAPRALQCRSQTCRIEIAGADAERLDRQLPLLAGRLASSFGTVVASRVDEGDGTQAMVLYLSR